MKRALVSLSLSLALVLAIGEVPAAERLGRLFFTPAQRAQLDVARSQKSRGTLASEQEESVAVPEVITYGGIVRRNDGKTTVWINNRPINDGKGADRLPVTSRVRPDGSVHLEVPQTNRSFDLNVGQSAEIQSGTIQEPYARSPVAARPVPKPAAARDNSAAAKPESASQPPPGTRKDPDDDGPDHR